MRPTNRRNTAIYRSYHSFVSYGVARIITLAAFICKARSVMKVNTIISSSSQEYCLGT